MNKREHELVQKLVDEQEGGAQVVGSCACSSS